MEFALIYLALAFVVLVQAYIMHRMNQNAIAVADVLESLVDDTDDLQDRVQAIENEDVPEHSDLEMLESRIGDLEDDVVGLSTAIEALQDAEMGTE